MFPYCTLTDPRTHKVGGFRPRSLIEGIDYVIIMDGITGNNVYCPRRNTLTSRAMDADANDCKWKILICESYNWQEDIYDHLGRNTSAHERRQNLEEWILIENK